MEKLNFKNKGPDAPEIDQTDTQITEIGPDTNSEKGKYDIAIINGVLNDIKKKEKEDKAKEKQDKKKKPN